MAYNRYYGFRENPFNQTPDSAFFFPSPGHKEALDALLYAIKQRKGFVVITGEIGSGKTTVVRTLLGKLDPRVQTALIVNTHLSPKGVITLILQDLGIPYSSGGKEKLLIQLYDYLLQRCREDKNVVLLIDEAQNLTPACLEEVRMLSNLETEKEKLIQIILIGQPELKKKLEMSQLAQLRQRIAVHYHLEPLGEEDTRKYILHRLNAVKINGRDYGKLFDDEALALIYKHSGGTPRVINHFCDHALLAGFVADAKVISASIAEETAASIFRSQIHSQERP